MTRRPIFGGNWKMNPPTASEARGLAEDMRKRLGTWHRSDLVLFAPAPYLSTVRQPLHGSRILLGTQDLHQEAKGAHTGAASASMLQSVGATWALVGHSERRHEFGESDTVVHAKLYAALGAGLSAILCIGETEGERDRGQTMSVLIRQLDSALHRLDSFDRLALAYEPVWAIGTGKVASPELAQRTHLAIRDHLSRRYGRQGRELRIQYGGSVKPGNAAALMAMPDIDGALVGGASLSAQDFYAIVASAR